MNYDTSRQERFLALYEPVRPNIERFVRALARRWNDDHEAAQDLLADTIAATYERFDGLRKPEALLSFMFTIATRLHRKCRAREARYTRLELGAENEMDGANAVNAAKERAEHSAHSDADRYDVARLYEALDKLPDKQREAVIMFEILGFAMKEIQAVQGGSLVAIKVRVSRGRATLTKLLTEQETVNEEQEAGSKEYQSER
jgi:RNA polymerase sigma-70 factor (ECF subfamily)